MGVRGARRVNRVSTMNAIGVKWFAGKVLVR